MAWVMRAGLLVIAAMAMVFTPTVSAEETLGGESCLTTYALDPSALDPSAVVARQASGVNVAYCVGIVFAILEEVTKPEAA